MICPIIRYSRYTACWSSISPLAMSWVVPLSRPCARTARTDARPGRPSVAVGPGRPSRRAAGACPSFWGAERVSWHATNRSNLPLCSATLYPPPSAHTAHYDRWSTARKAARDGGCEVWQGNYHHTEYYQLTHVLQSPHGRWESNAFVCSGLVPWIMVTQTADTSI